MIMEQTIDTKIRIKDDNSFSTKRKKKTEQFIIKHHHHSPMGEWTLWERFIVIRVDKETKVMGRESKSE